MRPHFRHTVLALLAAGALLTACGSAGSDPAPATHQGQEAPAALVSAPTSITAPPVNGVFDYQIGGAYTPRSGVTIVDRDRGSTPVAGLYSICYVNAFQTQDEDAAFWTKQHPDLLVHDNGKPLKDPDWPEYLLDTSTAAHRTALMAIVGPWIDGCAAKGFRAVEPDNLDTWTRSKGHLTQDDNYAFATLLITRSHRDHLAIAQKNAAETATRGKRAGFDFAIAEECQVYGECGKYTAAYGDHVIEIEYDDNPLKYFPQACQARGASISVILRDRDVVAAGKPDYDYKSC